MNERETEIKNLNILKYTFNMIEGIYNNHPDENTVTTKKIIENHQVFKDVFDQEMPIDSKFESWFKDLINNDKYMINLFSIPKINRYVSDEFKVSSFDRCNDNIYFIDRFQPDYRFNYDRFEQINAQIKNTIKQLETKQIKP